jgi:hypothetical protein
MKKIIDIETKNQKVQDTLHKAQEMMETFEESMKYSTEDPRENVTMFSGNHPGMKSGSYKADDSGIYSYNKKDDSYSLVSYTPMLITKKINNIQTEQEQIVLAYMRNGVWKEITVPRETIYNSRKIVELSGVGIHVTSGNARKLMGYLADIEHLNEDTIPVEYATAKLGWYGDEFIPYSDEYIFGGEDIGLKSLYQSLEPCGDADVWLSYMKALREENDREIRVMLAASFASVLVQRLNALPFVVNLWGESGNGKSVALKVAASVWGNPSGNQYIGDFESTNVALEVKSDFLNSLPLMLDDTSKINYYDRRGIESVVYELASGKGRSRSNTSIGIDREREWSNCTLTTGEKPISSHYSQGGAEARTLELECQKNVFKNPVETLNIIQNNYGWGGQMFVELVQAVPQEDLQEVYDFFVFALRRLKPGIMGKQLSSMAIMMAADKLATEFLFCDTNYIPIETTLEMVKCESQISDNEQCYQDLLDYIEMNASKFDITSTGVHYGRIDGDTAIFYRLAFNNVCRELGYSSTAFLQWAVRNGIVISDKGRLDKNRKLTEAEAANEGCTQKRSVFLKLKRPENETMDNEKVLPMQKTA